MLHAPTVRRVVVSVALALLAAPARAEDTPAGTSAPGAAPAESSPAASAAPATRPPPPAVIIVPLLGPVLLPLTLPVATPTRRRPARPRVATFEAPADVPPVAGSAP
jgi:hypothetical protein